MYKLVVDLGYSLCCVYQIALHIYYDLFVVWAVAADGLLRSRHVRDAEVEGAEALLLPSESLSFSFLILFASSLSCLIPADCTGANPISDTSPTTSVTSKRRGGGKWGNYTKKRE